VLCSAQLTLDISQRPLAAGMLPLKRLEEADEHLVLDAALEGRVGLEGAERVVLDWGLVRAMFVLFRCYLDLH
jgi:hypothetical protein